MRSKKVFKNTVWGLISEVVVLICGFIVPRLILTDFGSEYNGVTSVIKQFLQVIALFQAGIGGVTMAALYKPLQERDNRQISVIVKTTESYLRKIAIMFIGVSLLIAIILPSFVKEFDHLFTAGLVIIMSLSTFAQYFFGQTYQFLLSADQRQGFMYGLNSAKVIMNTVVSAMLIRLGFGIHIVMLGSAVVYAISPIFLYAYVRNKYKLMRTVKPDNSALKQRWDNFGIQVANFITTNTDLVVLSGFANMVTVSIYTVYNMVISGVFGLFAPFISGVTAAFGNMFAKNENELLKKNIRLYEQVVFALSTFLFGVAAAMIMSFVGLYTQNVNNNLIYCQPIFAYTLIAATLFRAFRYPYNGITNAAGHFRQNRNLSFVEAGINIIISVALAMILENEYKLVGVAVGTLIAYVFRTIRYAMYVSKNLIPRSNWLFVKRICLSLMITTMITTLPHILPMPQPTNWMTWILLAVVVSIIAFILALGVELIFYRDDLKRLLDMLKGILRNRKSVRE